MLPTPKFLPLPPMWHKQSHWRSGEFLTGSVIVVDIPDSHHQPIAHTMPGSKSGKAGPGPQGPSCSRSAFHFTSALGLTGTGAVTHARERQSNRTHRSQGTDSSNKNGLLPFAHFRDALVESQDFSKVLPTVETNSLDHVLGTWSYEVHFKGDTF